MKKLYAIIAKPTTNKAFSEHEKAMLKMLAWCKNSHVNIYNQTAVVITNRQQTADTLLFSISDYSENGKKLFFVTGQSKSKSKRDSKKDDISVKIELPQATKEQIRAWTKTGAKIEILKPEKVIEKVDNKEYFTNLCNYIDTNIRMTDIQRLTFGYEKDLEKQIVNLVQVSTFSVLKKIHEKSGNPIIRDLQKGLVADLSHVEKIKTENATPCLEFNKNGDLVQTAQATKDTLHNYSFSDGYNIYLTAYENVMEYVSGIQNGTIPHNRRLSKPYTDRALSKKVYIQGKKSCAFKDIEIIPIKEIFKSIRREIQNFESLKNVNNKFVYFNEIVTDELTGKTEHYYSAHKGYLTNGSFVTDINGKQGLYTASDNITFDYYTLLEKLNLTDYQARILELRMKNYGYKAIGTYFGISHNAVINNLKKIQNKVIKSGLISIELIEKAKTKNN